MKSKPISFSIRRRGAVLGEASIVILVLTLFFGAITYFHKALAAKIDAQQDTRQAAFDASANNCNGSPSSSPKNSSFNAGESPIFSSAGSDLDPEVTDVLNLFIAAQSPFDYNTSNTTAERNVDGSVSSYTRNGTNVEFKKNYLSATLKGSSWVMCNPAPRDGNLEGFFEFGKDYFVSHITNLGELISGFVSVVKEAIKSLF